MNFVWWSCYQLKPRLLPEVLLALILYRGNIQQREYMPEAEPKGCLAAILKLFGINLASPAETGGELPYRLRDDFLSAAELAFYRVLVNAIGNRAVICPKVNLADILFVAQPSEGQRYRNKIDRKHIDFLLCDPDTMKPRCGIELDDSSHARRDRQARDEFVDQAFAVARLPLIRVPAKAAYSVAGLLALFEPQLSAALVPSAPSVPPVATGTLTCPKCGVPLVERVARKGPNAGQSFFGCPNYPKCRETVLR